MAELKMNSLGPHNPFCSIESGAKSWGYKWVCTSWHSYDHDVPLNLDAQFIWQKNETVQFSNFLTLRVCLYLFPELFWSECGTFLSECDRTRKTVSLFGYSWQVNIWPRRVTHALTSSWHTLALYAFNLCDSISVRWSLIDQEGWRAGFRKKKHFIRHIRAVWVTQKPFHISGLEARGNKCMVKPLHFLNNSHTT